MDSLMTAISQRSAFTASLTIRSIDAARQIDGLARDNFGFSEHELALVARKHVARKHQEYLQCIKADVSLDDSRALGRKYLKLEEEFADDLAAIVSATEHAITAQLAVNRFERGVRRIKPSLLDKTLDAVAAMVGFVVTLVGGGLLAFLFYWLVLYLPAWLLPYLRTWRLL